MNKFKFFLFISFCFFSLSALASFNKISWPIWEVFNPISTETISHQEWQVFLDKRVITNEEGINLVDYAHLTRDDINLIKGYINRLSQINIGEYNRREQLAYWLNLYNAITVHVIASYYPVSSIEDINISPGLFSIGPWGAKLVKVNQTSLSLDEIQNRIIRPIWNDPRCHYALNNGAVASPNLAKIAYEGVQLEDQLNKAAYEYINSMRGVQIIDGDLILSKLYDWYKDDFGGNEKNIIKHLKIYAKKPLKAQLDKTPMIENFIYNWHLNATTH